MLIESCYRDSVTRRFAGSAICYVQKGSGSPLLLLHGIPLGLLTWRHNLDALAQHFSVLAIDMKGFGRSDKPAGNYSLGSHRGVILAILNDLGIARASIAGSSYGGAVAIDFAVAHPDRVNKLILINSAGFPCRRHSAERLLRMRLTAALARPVLRMNRLGKFLFRFRLRESYADPRQATPELVDAYYHLLRRCSGEDSYLATLRQFREPEVSRMIPALVQPTLIIWGARDRVLPASNADHFHRQIRGSSLHVLPESGHLPHEESPEHVNRLIGKFLTGPA
jgi:pimeloyl-ACP methyl ester carboxylesterase